MLAFRLKRIFLYIIWAYLLLGLYLYIFQRHYLYLPDKKDFFACENFESSEKITYGDTRFYYRTSDADTVAVFYHGNRGGACDRGYFRFLFESMGYDYILVEYAGYAGDAVPTIPERLFSNARDVIDFIETKDYRRVIVVGESLGSSVATYHSRQSPPDKLALLGAFSSTLDVAISRYPFYPIKYLMQDNLDNQVHLADYQHPILMIHGTQDQVVPYKLGEKLYKQIPSPYKFWLPIVGGHHSDIYGFDATTDALKAFFEMPA